MVYAGQIKGLKYANFVYKSKKIIKIKKNKATARNQHAQWSVKCIKNVQRLTKIDQNVRWSKDHKKLESDDDDDDDWVADLVADELMES